MQLTAGVFAGGSDASLYGARLTLTPAQQKIAEEVLATIASGQVCVLRAAAGMGKTTLLRHLQAQLGCGFVAVRQFLKLLQERSPVALEETFMDVLDRALTESEIVLVDDLHLLTAIVQGYEYPRAGLFNAVMSAVLAEADVRGSKLVFAVDGENEPASVRQRALVWEMEDLEADDFASLCRYYLGGKAEFFEFEKIHRFAPALNGHQLRNACLWLARQEGKLSTESFLEHLRAHNLASNVDLEEVEPVTWADLKGMDDVIEELEAKIALPFENDVLAIALDLKPKRGVLLAGPPGTGKTTIGRALAHRLKGKFFLIDGTINASDGNFYEQVKQVFEAAKKNAPSVIFIDDADVIFEAGNHGLYRYLLTMMDGLESASTGQVCVVLTAMDASALPRPLLRAGRVELWLQTRLPDERARETIWRERLSGLPAPICFADASLLARQSYGLSGADLKSVVEEGKLLYAHALANGRDCLSIETFFLRAITTSRANRRGYGKRRKAACGDINYGFPVA